MKRYILLGVLLPALSLPVHAEPTGTVANGDFEQTKDSMPVNWTLPDPRPDLKVTLNDEKGHGKIVQLTVSNNLKSAAVSQKIKIAPHTRYRLSALARLSDGKLFIGVQDGDDASKIIGRNYGEPDTKLPMLPLFWEEAWSQSVPFKRGEWQMITFDFESQEMTQIYLSFGPYFAVGKYAFDDISLLALGPSPKPNE